MLQLNKLTPAGKKRKRVGRGGSRGGTSGRGHKGQRARTSGNVRAGFEGGQMPLARRVPKRGFSNARFKKEFIPVGILRLEELFSMGDTVNPNALIEKGVLTARNSYFKVLGGDSLTKQLTVNAHAFSVSARDAIERAGGQAIVIKEI